jgi:hypothetical protein
MSLPTPDIDILIDQLERAPRPDPELDWQIYIFLNPSEASVLVTQRYIYEKPYTASVDAALTLVLPPEKGRWSLELMHPPSTPLRPIGSNGAYKAIVGRWGDDQCVGRHERAAIALCIAALKARVREAGK